MMLGVLALINVCFHNIVNLGFVLVDCPSPC